MNQMRESGSRTQRKKLAAWLAATIALAAVGAVTAWAVYMVVRPPDDPLGARTLTFATVEAGTVEASLNLNVIAEWRTQPIATNNAVGVVTGVSVAPGAEVAQGAVLYTVNLEPVAAAQGSVPAFRSIARDTQGADVQQLQQMLFDLGFYAGAIDGKAGARTVEAIEGWQEAIGAEETGVVELGDLVFIPTLPTRISLDPESIVRGAQLLGGEKIVQGLSAAPDFTLPVTDSQAAMMPAGTRVEVLSPEGTEWDAAVAGYERDAQNQTITITLEGLSGGSVCGDQCTEIPVVGQTVLSSRIVTVEPVTGLVVPSAALVTSSDGTVALLSDADERLPVTVVASARGMSVVEGVAAGTRVQIPAETVQ